MQKIIYPKKIQSFFEEIVDEIQSVLDPEFIIIAGSFGKAAWLYSGNHLLSDFEFEFICSNKWSIKKKKSLVKKLNLKYPYDISLTGHLINNVKNKVSSNYSNNYSGYIRLDFYDAFSNSQILYSKNKLPLDVNMSLGEVPSWEAWRLYINRIGDILSLQLDGDNNDELKNYFWLKIFESTADAYFLVNKIYNKNISIRYELFTEELLKEDIQLTKTCKDSVQIIKNALNARKEHSIRSFDNNVLSDINKNNIIISWLNYFEKKVIEDEHLSEITSSFNDKYLKSRSFQKKYLEVNNSFAIPLSNGIRFLFHNKKLIKLKFKFYNLKVSWRHIILMVVSELYKDSLSQNNFHSTKKILSELLPKREINKMSDEDLLITVLQLWKILR